MKIHSGGFNHYTIMFRVDRSIEEFWIDGDMKKWPLGLMEVDQSTTRLGQREALGGRYTNWGINDENKV